MKRGESWENSYTTSPIDQQIDEMFKIYKRLKRIPTGVKLLKDLRKSLGDSKAAETISMTTPNLTGTRAFSAIMDDLETLCEKRISGKILRTFGQLQIKLVVDGMIERREISNGDGSRLPDHTIALHDLVRDKTQGMSRKAYEDKKKYYENQYKAGKQRQLVCEIFGGQAVVLIFIFVGM